jgi:outer membrane protein assembly factor BamB
MKVEIIIVCLSLVLMSFQPPTEISPHNSDGPTVPIELHIADSPWPMFRQNLNHTGLSPYDTSGNPGKLRWSFTTNYDVRSSPAIGSDGTIYVGSGEKPLYGLYAINSDGTEKWWFPTGDHVYSSPAIGSDGTIYVGSNDHRLYAINPDGTEKWRLTTGKDVHSSPAIGSDGTVYVGSDDRRLYAINPDGTQKWRFITGDYVDSSPAIGSDGTVYVGSDDNRLYAINPDGTEKWNFTTGDSVRSSPAIGSDGTVYIGSYDCKLYAINPDGTEKWNFTTGDSVRSSPAIGSDGTIYVGSNDHRLYAINPDGTEKWSFTTGALVYSSPAIGSDGTVYVGSYDWRLYAINPDGTEKWRLTTGFRVPSSPAIGSDGTVYVGSDDHRLYAIGMPQNQPPELTLDVDPDTLNLNSKGRWITAYITAENASIGDIDPSSLLLNDLIPPAWWDIQDNTTLMVKFDRAAVQAILSVSNAIDIKITGQWKDGKAFELHDVIRVIDVGGHMKSPWSTHSGEGLLSYLSEESEASSAYMDIEGLQTSLSETELSAIAVAPDGGERLAQYSSKVRSPESCLYRASSIVVPLI